MVDGTVTATSDAIAENGEPLYSIVYSEPVKAEPEATIAAEPEATTVPQTAVASETTVEAVAPIVSAPLREKPEVYDSRVLTIEEQKEIALKVCFFFITIVMGSFGILYVYHRMQQKTKENQSDKTTL